MAIKSAISNVDKTFNDDLFDYFCTKDDVSFRRAWRKRYCSSSVKTANVINDKHGDIEICAEFTQHFQSVFKTNTVNSNKHYESELQEILAGYLQDGRSGSPSRPRSPADISPETDPSSLPVHAPAWS